MNVVFQLLAYMASFFFLWYGSGIIVETVKVAAQKIKISRFAFSFFVLGLLTSIPEIAVGVNSLKEGAPEIFVGNLLGGIIVMFLLVIPLLALIGHKVKIRDELNGKNLIVTLGIISAPSLFALDKAISSTEGVVLLALYTTLFYIIRTKQGFLSKFGHAIQRGKKLDLRLALKLALGIIIVILTSNFIVEQTLEYAKTYNLSVFLVSLIGLSLGTNLPEITLAIRSFTNKAEDVALGDYLGSAAANSLIFGVLTLVNNGQVVTDKSFLTTFLFIMLAICGFFIFIRSRNHINRKEALLLMAGYLIFLAVEAIKL